MFRIGGTRGCRDGVQGIGGRTDLDRVEQINGARMVCMLTTAIGWKPRDAYSRLPSTAVAAAVLAYRGAGGP
ncbi:conserved hypothetical protein [Xanthomonas campestris pv. campestris str. 8004]|uniref:Uncharacterized protein n=1 Tax=Xanthomonas campestris pv. campestris (strain 8004) TaxID=314565 RepID=A0A0H2XB43_XANC8|nr:conserved hypothetical protein [Xanthomonas campestris pv. campestris str. 8004]AKS17478.1 hypothetical protein AEA00_17195 [Xanthomonas campestris pv. campestris]QCX66984.1 hypothetical protein DFG55_11625 [Xanthomonas campestris pv. campestris]QCX72520.1 hypothetical protein DFG54_18790 [Xanthomonas campestris pv. campestris]RFF49925.1 hypothetical protein D0A42_04660 [Xanthomonas campestris pv. campestris]